MDAERIDRLDAMIAEGRLIREKWTEGHDRACLLTALSPEAGAAQSAAACPAELMPMWLAYLTPWLDDAPSAEAWPHIVRRYASLARRWHVLDGRAWDRARIVALLAIVEEIRMHTGDDARVLSAADGVLAWLRRGAPHREGTCVCDAAWAARAVAADAAAADAAAYAAYAAALAPAAAEAEAWAAAAAADAAWAASRAAADAAEDASDRMASGVLDAIEREIEKEEAGR